MIPILCLCSIFCVSERGKLCHTYSMFLIYLVCIGKAKLYHTYIMFMLWILCIWKSVTVSYQQYVYVLYVVYQKEENCVIHTICLWSRLCVSERGKQYHIHSMFMNYMLFILNRENVSFIQCAYDLGFVYQKQGNCVIHAVCFWSMLYVSEKGNCIIPTLCLCSGFCVSERV